MNFRRLPLLVALFWVAAAWALGMEVLGLRHDRAQEGGMEGAEKKNEADIDVLTTVLKTGKSFAQSFRRSLKAIRKWRNSHPSEVKLAKCFVSYFDIKIPGVRRYAQDDEYGGYRTSGKKPKKIKDAEKERTEDDFHTDIFILFNKRSLNTAIISALSSFFKDVYRFWNAFTGNKLLSCFWEYFNKKFWTWVDSAPDS